MYPHKDTDFLLHLPNNLSGDSQKHHGISGIICTKEKNFCTKTRGVCTKQQRNVVVDGKNKTFRAEQLHETFLIKTIHC